MRRRSTFVLAALGVAAGLVVGAAMLSAQDRAGLRVARYTNGGELVYPDDLDAWIVMGASLGADYNEAAFDPQAPGTIGVVQMEPNAYRYFLENRKYADGTMFLLSFFEAEAQSDPQLQGFVQGDLRGEEIHVIDRERFDEGRGFFVFGVPGGSAGKIPNGSECVRCHTAEADYDATFTQFYPAIRDLL